MFPIANLSLHIIHFIHTTHTFVSLYSITLHKLYVYTLTGTTHHSMLHMLAHIQSIISKHNKKFICLKVFPLKQLVCTLRVNILKKCIYIYVNMYICKENATTHQLLHLCLKAYRN